MTPLGKCTTHDFIEESREEMFWFDLVVFKCKKCKTKKTEVEKIK